ncbi:MAG: iron-sulfur cluster assembly scaffold protein [Candidatus Hydrogenedentota bacterium]
MKKRGPFRSAIKQVIFGLCGNNDTTAEAGSGTSGIPEPLFSSTARDHAEHPRHYGPLEHYNGYARITGPCGDTMEYWLQVENGTVVQIGFNTDGCGASHACGSMAAYLACGRARDQVKAITQQDILDALGGLPESSQHCALLAANTLHAACEESI